MNGIWKKLIALSVALVSLYPEGIQFSKLLLLKLTNLHANINTHGSDITVVHSTISH